MKLVVMLGIACLVLGQDNGKTKPSPLQLVIIKGLISTMFVDDPDLIPSALRLSFHDCVSERCDGCLNLDNERNKGMETIVEALQWLSTNPVIGPFLSNADLWSLAGIVAVEEGVKISNEFCTKNGCSMMPALTTAFKWGRIDCATSPTTSNLYDFPIPEMSRQEMMTYFDDNFGFDENDVTALLGAHTMGSAAIENSGYSGTWVEGKETHFNNQYYDILSGSGGITFSNDANDPDDGNADGNLNFQFNLFNGTKRAGMMLNTDMELAFDIDVSMTAGTQCQVRGGAPTPGRGPRAGRSGRPGPRAGQAGMETTPCPKASTIGLVDAYAADPAAFVRDFSSVFERMMEKGNPNLESV